MERVLGKPEGGGGMESSMIRELSGRHDHRGFHRERTRSSSQIIGEREDGEASVSNGSRFRDPFRFQVGTKPGPLQWASMPKLLLKWQHMTLQLSTSVLIISRRDLYVKYQV